MSQVIRPDAQLDIDNIAAHLEGNVSGLGSRFLRQLEATLTHLEHLPGLGTPYPLSHPGLSGLRAFPVKRFTSYFVFYLPTPDGIDVVRVLHGARNIDPLLEGEP
jgi:toxin ParE1/3/4